MLNLKYFYILISILISAKTVLGMLSEEEELRIPFYAQITEEFTPEGVEESIPVDFRFVVLRPLDGNKVLGDFPRRGIYAVDIGNTDIRSLLDSTKEKTPGSVAVPRMSYFFANKIISGESEWLHPLRYDVVNEFSRWIIVYGNSDEQTTREAIKSADKFYRRLTEENRAKTCLVYLDPLGNKQNIASIAAELKPLIQSMPGYLSRGYVKSLSHIGNEDVLPSLVEVSSSGRILGKYDGLESLQSYFRASE